MSDSSPVLFKELFLQILEKSEYKDQPNIIF